MSTTKILEAFKDGMTAEEAVLDLGISMKRACRLKECVDCGKPVRKPGSGRIHTKIGRIQEIADLLLRGPDGKSNHRLWTVASLHLTLKTELSVDTIRRRLDRSGLNLKFPASQRNILTENIGKEIPPGKRPICLIIGQTELDLVKFTADSDSQESDGFLLPTLCAADGHGAIRFRCYSGPITQKERADFLESLRKQCEERLLICGTRLAAKDISDMRPLLHDDVLLVKLPD